ncbi:MAG TPA: amidohydrolase family protein [Puia sp.]|nr:amidohydrolase family protein [Puia sp.]
MTYLKFRADDLFTGEGFAGPDSVLVTSGEGVVQAVVPAAAAGEDVVYYPGVLSPGFVNCHCHLELSGMRGVIPEGTGLVDFLSAVVRGRGSARPGDTGDQGDAIAAGEQEMLDNGIVAVGDICNGADTLIQKRKGRLRYSNFIETMGFIEGGAKMRFDHSLRVLEELRELGAGVIVPHAPYSVSPALFRMIAGHAGSGRVLSIHNQETEAENVFLSSGEGDFLRLYAALGLDVSFFRGTGKRSLASWLGYIDKAQPMIVVHNVATREEDLGAAEGYDLHFCLCPNANLYIGGQLPDVGLLVRKGCSLVVGTDSLASNHALSILGELKTLQRAFPELGTPQLLRWATLNGARALGMEGELGSFGAGKRPGVVLLEGMREGRLEGARVKRLV